MRALTETLRGSGLDVIESARELAITNPLAPDKGTIIVVIDGSEEPYFSWEHPETRFWDIGHDPESDEAREFIAGKAAELLGTSAADDRAACRDQAYPVGHVQV